MKKIFITMLAAVAATTSFAQGNPKIEKEISKAENYQAGKAIFDAQAASLTDEQKGLAYNGLVELNYPAASKVFEAFAVGKKDGLDYLPVKQCIDDACAGDALNQKYHKKNLDRLQNFRVLTIIGGQNLLNEQKNDEAVKYFETYVNSSNSSLFKEVAGAKDPNRGNVARICAYIYAQKGMWKEAQPYAEIAYADSASRKDIKDIYTLIYEKQCKTKADTLALIEKMKEVDYDKNFARIMSFYNQIGEKELATKLLDEAIARNPNNKMAYAVKGENAMQNRDYETAIANFKKVTELDPSFVEVWFNLGVCTSQKGFDLNEKYTDKQGKISIEHKKEVEAILKDAIAAYEKVRELDPNHEKITNWPMQLRMLYNAVGDSAKAKEISDMLGDN